MTVPAFDVVFVGGSAFTAGWEDSRPWGVGVRDGRIAAVGSEDRLRADADGATRVVDLAGGLLVPAFHDAHAHPVTGGVELLQCDLSGAATAEECLSLIAAYAAAHPDEEWIVGGGWTMSHFPGGLPAAAAIDRILPDRPVALQNRDHHGMWVNGEALRRAGVTPATPDPADGRIERHVDGSPSGVLHEGAMRLIEAVIPETRPELVLAGLRRAQAEFFAQGIVGWADAWVGRMPGVGDILDTYVAALEQGVLRARVTAALWWERSRGIEQLADLAAQRERIAALGRSEVLRADAIKIMVDGVAENFTAAMSRPYLDGCGHPTTNAGMTFLAPAALAEAAIAADAAGFHLHFHALGDRAVTLALDALEAARARNGHGPRRHQLAHLQVVQPDDVPRFAALGVAANLQMLWGAVDEQLAELTFPFLEPELVARHYPFRDLRDAGAALAAGSDWPVSTADPLEAIRVGATRASAGAVADPRLDPRQAIDLASAFAAYTAGSAAINGHGAQSGRLRVGMRADLAVLDGDPFVLGAESLDGICVAQTWADGAIVHGEVD
ncbi:amidohydrolase [Microbacterium sp. cx-59]|uniref:amidohydrolase n=1 Tax=Microbacterium sp. cx-59 TaxID=2891207 RepID=UPI001E4F13EA|nr:amidohydrolase [Microbacterium sp. cx-59]MCC4908335.1 amidohydrolase [Microbacterium sp. cx-59]